jgi:hypothetical protein
MLSKDGSLATQITESLHEALHSGVDVSVIEFEDDDDDLLLAWAAAAHDVDSNKYRASRGTRFGPSQWRTERSFLWTSIDESVATGDVPAAVLAARRGHSRQDAQRQAVGTSRSCDLEVARQAAAEAGVENVWRNRVQPSGCLISRDRVPRRRA